MVLSEKFLTQSPFVLKYQVKSPHLEARYCLPSLSEFPPLFDLLEQAPTVLGGTKRLISAVYITATAVRARTLALSHRCAIDFPPFVVFIDARVSASETAQQSRDSLSK
ncbi:unnamed protein product [Parnassius apollo]|uniref:(apollo) hypothetical protein n=1 Tax=Parnassius apollo TaxID=110799 RepID=A0A8S3X3B9_PARAO|nr:unnamed protein product [Parnassius apollo]